MFSLKQLANRLKIGTKLYLGFGFLTILILVIAFAGWLGIERLQRGLQVLKYYETVSDTGRHAILDSTKAINAANDQIYTHNPGASEKTQSILQNVLNDLEKIEKEIKDDPYQPADAHKEFLEKLTDTRNAINEYDVINKQYSELQKLREEKNNTFNGSYKQCGLLLGEILKFVDDPYRERTTAASTEGDIPLLYFRKNKVARDCRGALTAFKISYDAYQLAMGEEAGKKARDAALISYGKFNGTTKVFATLPWADEQLPAINKITQNAEALHKDLLEISKAVDEQNKLLTQKIAKEKIFDQEMEELMGMVTVIYRESEKRNDANLRQTSFAMIGFSVIVLIVALLAALGTARNIVPGIKKIDWAIEQIARTGDLNIEIDKKYKNRLDEIGDLADSLTTLVEEFRAVECLGVELGAGNWQVSVQSRGELDLMNIHLNSMLEIVNKTLGKTTELVQQVAAGAVQIASASESLSQGATESAASLEEINASMAEISNQTNKNAQSAGEANRIAHEANKEATEGQEMMRNMIDAMSLITKNSQNVQTVVKVIDDISFQTNLLALNAAVEAARAGTHGKGFAVVAEEVRNLASRSAKAAAETTQMIENNSRQINAGAAIAAETAEKLNGIVEESQKVAALLADIAKASSEQAQGVSQVSHGLSQIDSVTQQNTAAAEETASVSNEMSGQASELQKLVGQFKLREAQVSDNGVVP